MSPPDRTKSSALNGDIAEMGLVLNPTRLGMGGKCRGLFF